MITLNSKLFTLIHTKNANVFSNLNIPLIILRLTLMVLYWMTDLNKLLKLFRIPILLCVCLKTILCIIMHIREFLVKCIYIGETILKVTWLHYGVVNDTYYYNDRVLNILICSYERCVHSFQYTTCSYLVYIEVLFCAL